MKTKKYALISHSQKSKMAAAADNKWKKDAADQNFDYMFKLLIIGNSSVGKTSFLFRYADDSFTSAFVSTVGIDFKVKTVFRNDKRIKLQIWDTGSIGVLVKDEKQSKNDAIKENVIYHNKEKAR
eukprot:Seg3060.4 transcript_id=Seg3060.4/GoldUCD/mRNA.D3Y31 product="Ras-related protein Rab-3" protein_id=Seg3060.4/GoldUCD/D3Y31